MSADLLTMERTLEAFSPAEIDQLENGIVFYVAVYPSKAPGYLTVC